jgi:hypothetical protein
MPAVSRAPVPRLWFLSIALVALAGALAIYPASLAFDLHIDDFVSLRPWPGDTLWHSLTGTWHDYPGAPGFYRPVPILYYAAAFSLFGLNAPALHVLPLVVVPVCGWLVGVFVWRESGSRAAAALGALLFVVHPGTTISLGPWIANQYQGFAIIFTLAAFLLWQRCRDRPLAAWAPLIVPLVLAGFTKEHALTLPLVIVGAQWIIARWTGTLAPPSRSVMLAAAGLFAAMNAWRVLMLGGVGGYDMPSAPDLLLNLLRGPYFILIVQLGDAPWSLAATALSAVCVGAALASAVRERTRATTRITLLGGVLILVTNIPLAFMTSMSRSYLITLGAVFILTAGAASLARWTAMTRRPLAATAALALLVVPLTVLSRNRLMLYAPCSEETRQGHEWIRDERLQYLAPEFGPWLDAHISSCNPATYRPLVETLPVATWQLPNGRTAVLVSDRFVTATLQVESAGASPEHPVLVEIVLNGRPLPPLSLTTAGWTGVPLSLSSSWRTRLRRSHRIDVRTLGGAPIRVRVEGRPPGGP